MRLDVLSTLNTERAARRAVAVVTDIATGEQRLVKSAARGFLSLCMCRRNDW